MTDEKFPPPQPAHTPGPWVFVSQADWPHTQIVHVTAQNWGVVANLRIDPAMPQLAERQRANLRLIAAAPELLAACINARDMLATDRQAFVDCQQLRDSRTDDPIAHGLVAVEDGVWLDADDAEALRDYDRAIELIDKATAKATGAQA